MRAVSYHCKRHYSTFLAAWPVSQVIYFPSGKIPFRSDLAHASKDLLAVLSVCLLGQNRGSIASIGKQL
jgi:hypothetical protein